MLASASEGAVIVRLQNLYLEEPKLEEPKSKDSSRQHSVPDSAAHGIESFTATSMQPSGSIDKFLTVPNGRAVSEPKKQATDYGDKKLSLLLRYLRCTPKQLPTRINECVATSLALFKEHASPDFLNFLQKDGHFQVLSLQGVSAIKVNLISFLQAQRIINSNYKAKIRESYQINTAENELIKICLKLNALQQDIDEIACLLDKHDSHYQASKDKLPLFKIVKFDPLVAVRDVLKNYVEQFKGDSEM